MYTVTYSEVWPNQIHSSLGNVHACLWFSSINVSHYPYNAAENARLQDQLNKTSADKIHHIGSSNKATLKAQLLRDYKCSVSYY